MTVLGAAAPAATHAVPSVQAPVQVHGQTPVTTIRTVSEPPFDVTGSVTDRVGVLGGEVDDLEQELEALRVEHGVQLFVVFVDSFDGASGAQWAGSAFEASGMGGDDVLLAVAVQDRRYGTWAADDSSLTAEQDAAVRSRYIEPALGDDDWAGAVRGAVEGYGQAAQGRLGTEDQGSGDQGSGGGFPWLLVVPVGAVALVAASRRRARRTADGHGQPWEPEGQPAEPEVPTELLQRQVAAALVDLDDAVRSSAEELAFAEAQFGLQATRGFKQALDEARAHAARAFELQRALADDEAAGMLDEGTRRSRLQEILVITAEADRTLDAQEAEFARLRGLEATVPQFLDELASRSEEVRRRLPVAEQELAGLTLHHSEEALRTVRGNVAQATQLLDSVPGFLDTGRGHVTAGNRAAAVAAARAAEEAVGQADALLTAVSRAGEELATAQDRIEQALASLSSDVADADELGADDPLTTTALAEARAAIETGTAAREGGDPLAALRLLAKAEQHLDGALARYRQRDSQVARSRELLEQRMDQVAARLQSIDVTIQSRRGAVGPQARGHIAEALRTYDAAVTAAADDPGRAAGLLDAAEEHGELALVLAQEDIDSWSSGYGPGHRGGFGGIDAGSLILGGILGGAMNGMGGGRGGGWGGSGGGFGGGFGGGGSFGGGGGGFGGGGRF